MRKRHLIVVQITVDGLLKYEIIETRNTHAYPIGSVLSEREMSGLPRDTEYTVRADRGGQRSLIAAFGGK